MAEITKTMIPFEKKGFFVRFFSDFLYNPFHISLLQALKTNLVLSKMKNNKITFVLLEHI